MLTYLFTLQCGNEWKQDIEPYKTCVNKYLDCISTLHLGNIYVYQEGSSIEIKRLCCNKTEYK